MWQTSKNCFLGNLKGTSFVAKNERIYLCGVFWICLYGVIQISSLTVLKHFSYMTSSVWNIMACSSWHIRMVWGIRMLRYQLDSRWILNKSSNYLKGNWGVRGIEESTRHLWSSFECWKKVLAICVYALYIYALPWMVKRCEFYVKWACE